MESEETAVILERHDQNIKSLKHRMDKVEKSQEEIVELTKAVNELTINMKHMIEEIKEQGNRLEKMENEPVENAKYYKRTAIACVITTIIGAAIGAVLGVFL